MNRIDAILSLGFSCYGDGDQAQPYPNEKGDLPTEVDIQVEIKRLEKEYETVKYRDDRKAQYPDLGEQFDMLWHAVEAGEFGSKAKKTAFFQKLKAVKEKFPKKKD